MAYFLAKLHNGVLLELVQLPQLGDLRGEYIHSLLVQLGPVALRIVFHLQQKSVQVLVHPLSFGTIQQGCLVNRFYLQQKSVVLKVSASTAFWYDLARLPCESFFFFFLPATEISRLKS